MGFQHYDTGFVVPCSTLATGFILQFLPPWLAGLYTIFWEEEADLEYRATQPYVGMRKQAQPAHENLLLEYTCLPPLVASYIAFQKKHYDITWISIISLVQRLLPIIAAGSVTLESDEEATTRVYINPIACIATLVFILLGLPLIILARPSRERRLPHECATIGDMLSWCWDSELVRSECFNITIKSGNDRSRDVQDDRRLMEADLLSARGKYAFGTIKRDNGLSDGNHVRRRPHFGFDSEESERIEI